MVDGQWLKAQGVRIGALCLSTPVGIAPMAGLTDSPFRKLVKRHGGCGVVFTEMVSSEGLVRGMDRTLEFAEFSEEERPIAIQIFGSEPESMAAAGQILEARGADIVDVNMGCPVHKVVRSHAGCSLMREPERAAAVVARLAAAVRIPVTVKMRAGWSEEERNAPDLARRLEDAGAAAIAVHGRTAAQNYRGSADWDLVARIADELTIPVFGSGDCSEPGHVLARLQSGVDGVLVGRGVLRNPWILAQAADLGAGRPLQEVSLADRGRFLDEYLTLLLTARVRPRSDEPRSIRREAPQAGATRRESGDKWVVNKMRALAAWYTKGLENGSHLRIAINKARSPDEIRDLVGVFFTDQSSQASPVDAAASTL
jgi:tRNA-dihydrouridine synthase B